MPAYSSPAPRSWGSPLRVGVTAAMALGLVAVPLASPAFAKDQPAPAGSKAAAPGGGRSAGQPDGLLKGGVSMGLSAPFGSFKAVPGRPADAPIGVPFEALSRAGGALIRINNEDILRTSDPNNFAIAVINRHTREVVESGTVNRANTSMLGALATKYSGGNDFLMVISSMKGIGADPGNTNAFIDAVRKLGGRDLTGDELALLKNGAAFSVVGVPSGAPGGAYISIDRGGAPDGNVYGYLQINVANDLYGVVTREHPTFDTTNTSTTPGVAAIRFDHKTYTSDALPPGQSGFLLLSFDNALQMQKKQTVVTNGTGNDAGAQFGFGVAMDLFTRTEPKTYGSTVIVQSIGHPTPVAESWTNVAKIIEKLGGNRLGFNNLGRSGVASEYSLVGSMATPDLSVESSTVLGGRGALAGSLSHNLDMIYAPVGAGDAAGVNNELVDISYQTPQAFPAFTVGFPGSTTAGTAAADAYVGRALGLCSSATVQPTCSVRTAFYRNYSANFQQASVDLERLKYPGDAQGFTATDFEAVHQHLGDELSMVNRVRAYFAGLQKPFGEAASGSINIEALTDAIVNSADAPRGGVTATFVLGLISKIVSLGGFASGTVKSVSSGISAAFGLAAYLTQPDGRPQLTANIRVSATQLGAQTRAQMLAASRSLNGLSMLMISDYGKLRAVADRLPDDGWRLPDDTGPALAAMGLAVKQSAAEKLVPLAYPWLFRGTPERSAQSMSCGFGTTKHVFQVNVWEDQPANAALFDPRDYITSDGRTIPAPYWFAKGTVMGKDLTPSPQLTSMLFSPTNAERGTLGINLYAFLSPRVFGSIHQANDGAFKCNLG